MNSLFVILLICISESVFAIGKRSVLAELNYSKGQALHQYVLLYEPGPKPTYELKFMDEKKRIAALPLTVVQAQKIQQDIVKLMWDKQYRTPASQKNCHGYLSLRLQNEKATICLEQAKATGQAMGMLNGLNALYK